MHQPHVLTPDWNGGTVKRLHAAVSFSGMNVCVYVCMYVCMLTHVCMYVYMYVCMLSCTRASMHVCMR